MKNFFMVNFMFVVLFVVMSSFTSAESIISIRWDAATTSYSGLAGRIDFGGTYGWYYSNAQNFTTPLNMASIESIVIRVGDFNGNSRDWFLRITDKTHTDELCLSDTTSIGGNGNATFSFSGCNVTSSENYFYEMRRGESFSIGDWFNVYGSGGTDYTDNSNARSEVNGDSYSFGWNIGTSYDVSSKIFGNSTPVEPPSDVDLVSCWTFDDDDTEGSTAIDIVSGHNGDIIGATTGESCKVGECYDFDGTNDFVTLGDVDELEVTNGERTVGAWVYSDSLADHALFTKDGTVDRGFYHGFRTLGRMRTRIYDGASAYYHSTGNNLVSTGSWEFVVFISDGTNFKFYVDNVLEESDGGNTAGSTNSPQSADIGYHNNTNQYFNGRIDELFIYDRVLNTTEMTKIYNDSSGVGCRYLSPSLPTPTFSQNSTATDTDPETEDTNTPLNLSIVWTCENCNATGSDTTIDGISGNLTYNGTLYTPTVISSSYGVNGSVELQVNLTTPIFDINNTQLNYIWRYELTNGTSNPFPTYIPSNKSGTQNINWKYARIKNAIITPTNIYTNNSLNCSAEGLGANFTSQDTINFTWYNNTDRITIYDTAITGNNQNTIYTNTLYDYNSTSHFQNYTCQVTTKHANMNAGLLNTSTNSSVKTILNTPPTTPTNMTPENNHYIWIDSQNITCNGSTDLDGDTIHYELYGEGNLLSNSTNTIYNYTPLVTGNTYNWYCRAHDTYNVSDYTDNHSIILVNFTACNDSSPFINFSYYDEIEMDNSLNASLKGHFYLTLDSGQIKQFNYTDLPVATSHSFCLDNGNVTINGDWEYEKDQYDLRRYHFYNYEATSTDTNNIELYLLNISLANGIKITVEDDSGTALADRRIYIEKYLVGYDGYKLLFRDKTDDDGIANVHLHGGTQDLTATTYRFKIYYDDTLEEATAGTQVTDDLIIQIGAHDWSNLKTILNDVQSTLSYNNNSQTFTHQFSTSGGDTINGCMAVVETRNNHKKYTISNVCEESSSHTLQYTITPVTNYKYVAYSYVLSSGYNDYIDRIYYSEETNIFSKSGIIFLVLFMITLPLIGLFNPVAMIIYAVLGFVVSWIMGVISINESVIYGLIMIALILVFKMIKGER